MCIRDRTTKGGKGAKKAEKDAVKAREKFMAARGALERTDLGKAVVYWEDLGVDMLMADEAHRFKNLHASSRKFGAKNPKYLGGSGQSKTAFKMETMARFVREQSPDNSVYFLTATPIKNSPIEIFNMLQHIAPEALAKLGITTVEEFIDRHCLLEDRLVLNAKTQEVEKAAAVVGFHHLGELELSLIHI